MLAADLDASIDETICPRNSESNMKDEVGIRARCADEFVVWNPLLEGTANKRTALDPPGRFGVAFPAVECFAIE